MEQKDRIAKLIEELRDRGLTNGSSLGQHSGLYDEAADALEALMAEQEEYQSAKAEWRAVVFPVKIGETVSLLRNGHIEICTVHGFSSKVLGVWEVKLYPLVQDWLGNQSVTYRVRLSQFDKTWFKDSKKAEAAQEAWRKNHPKK